MAEITTSLDSFCEISKWGRRTKNLMALIYKAKGRTDLKVREVE
jgi:hypothetical protein